MKFVVNAVPVVGYTVHVPKLGGLFTLKVKVDKADPS